jgi:hypothetical protein
MEIQPAQAESDRGVQRLRPGNWDGVLSVITKLHRGWTALRARFRTISQLPELLNVRSLCLIESQLSADTNDWSVYATVELNEQAAKKAALSDRPFSLS